MNILCFTLSGKTAFFKKPEVNSYVSFTYGNIHKIALMGIFGAVLGYGGYTAKWNAGGGMKKTGKTGNMEKSFPEFYERLSGIHVAVAPRAERGFIRKKIQVFNNSVGYASGEQGGNLIVKEQWLEEPSWDVYVLLDCEEASMLCDRILAGKCVYIPYLGKNDHFADISDVRVEEACECKNGEGNIAALFPKEKGRIGAVDDFYEEQAAVTYKYEEKLPYELDAWTNNYILQSFVYTDAAVSWEKQLVYCVGKKNIMFY